MEKLYKEITNILESDKFITNDQCCLKLAEEVGELIRETNRLSGSKRKFKLSDEEIRNNILDEVADSLQNLFAVAIKHGISYNEIMKQIQVKNNEWKDIIKNK